MNTSSPAQEFQKFRNLMEKAHRKAIIGKKRTQIKEEPYVCLQDIFTESFLMSSLSRVGEELRMEHLKSIGFSGKDGCFLASGGEGTVVYCDNRCQVLKDLVFESVIFLKDYYYGYNHRNNQIFKLNRDGSNLRVVSMFDTDHYNTLHQHCQSDYFIATSNLNEINYFNIDTNRLVATIEGEFYIFKLYLKPTLMLTFQHDGSYKFCSFKIHNDPNIQQMKTLGNGKISPFGAGGFRISSFATNKRSDMMVVSGGQKSSLRTIKISLVQIKENDIKVEFSTQFSLANMTNAHIKFHEERKKKVFFSLFVKTMDSTFVITYIYDRETKKILARKTIENDHIIPMKILTKENCSVCGIDEDYKLVTFSL